MSLIHKPVTAKGRAARRANARLSTGPRSAAGKRHTSLNGLEHGVFAKSLEASIQELGERPADYARLRRGLRQSFAPEDGFERMLVEELAQICWRRQRLMRAESGLVAAKKRRYEIDRALDGSSHAGGLRQIADAGMVSRVGYAGLGDSVEKCDRLIGALSGLKEAVSADGFNQENEKFLDVAYGQVMPLAGIQLKASYRRNRKLAQAGKKGILEITRESFLAAVDKEIAAYRELRKLCRAKDLETTQTMKDAQLLPGTEDLGMILRYEAALGRQFKSKLRQLVAWRRAKKGRAAWEPEAPAEELGPESAPSGEAASPSHGPLSPAEAAATT